MILFSLWFTLGWGLALAVGFTSIVILGRKDKRAVESRQTEADGKSLTLDGPISLGIPGYSQRLYAPLSALRLTCSGTPLHL